MRGDKSAGVPIRSGLSWVCLNKVKQAIGESLFWLATRRSSPCVRPIWRSSRTQFSSITTGGFGRSHDGAMPRSCVFITTPVVSCRIASVVQCSGELNQRGVSISGKQLSTTCVLLAARRAIFREPKEPVACKHTWTSRFPRLRVQIQTKKPDKTQVFVLDSVW